MKPDSLFTKRACANRWKVLLIIWLGFLCAGCDNSSENPASTGRKIIVATDTTLIPMSFISDKGQIIGFEPDLLEAVSEITGFEYDLVNVEWPGLFGGLITKKFDLVISSVTILEERKEKMAFSVPYLKSGLALVVRKDTADVKTVQDLKDGSKKAKDLSVEKLFKNYLKTIECVIDAVDAYIHKGE